VETKVDELCGLNDDSYPQPAIPERYCSFLKRSTPIDCSTVGDVSLQLITNEHETLSKLRHKESLFLPANNPAMCKREISTKGQLTHMSTARVKSFCGTVGGPAGGLDGT
jgi:hypothetical protein